jgi:uncharacterized protein (TIGR02246 family)
MCRTLLSVSAILALASSASAQTSNSPLLELSKQFGVAMKARDAAKVASFYAEDAVTMSPNEQPVKGRNAIEADLRKMFQNFPDAEVTGTPIASEIAGDLGYVHGQFVTVGKTGQFKGHYVEVWKRVNGEWKILYDIWNRSDPPPAAPTPPPPPTPPTPPQ